MKKITALTMALALSLTGFSALAEFDSGKEIVVVSREDGSGTRAAFIEITGVETDEGDMTYEEAIIQQGTQQVMTNVGQNEYAIGYISMASVNETVRAISVDKVAATTENILAGLYPVARPFNIVLVKDKQLSPAAADFVVFIMSADGQKVVSDNKTIAVAVDAPAYAAANLEGKVVAGGSTSVAATMEKLAEAYMTLNPKVVIEIQSTGSSAGVTQTLQGGYDIGMASRAVKESEVALGAVGTAIAMDGIAVIVNPVNTLENVSLEQLRQIFVGELTAWSQITE